jgi:predicted RNase H-like HicB family nuclease
MRYTVILKDGSESGYVAICPALPGCVSQGCTKRGALKNIRKAIEAYIEALIDDGVRVPIERGRQTVEVEVEVTAR